MSTKRPQGRKRLASLLSRLEGSRVLYNNLGDERNWLDEGDLTLRRAPGTPQHTVQRKTMLGN